MANEGHTKEREAEVEARTCCGSEGIRTRARERSPSVRTPGFPCPGMMPRAMCRCRLFGFVLTLLLLAGVAWLVLTP